MDKKTLAYCLLFLLLGMTISVADVSQTEGVFWSRIDDTIVLTNESENVNIGQNETTNYRLYVNGTIATPDGNSSEWNLAFLWGDHSEVGYLTIWSDGDPFYNNSDAFHVTSELMLNWNESYSWGDHSLMGYLTDFNESYFNNSDAFHVTSALMSQWNESYSWGDHSLVGYLMDWSDGDPFYNNSDAFHVTSALMDQWNSSGVGYWSKIGNTIILKTFTNNLNIGENKTTDYKLNVNGSSFFNDTLIISNYTNDTFLNDYSYYKIITINSEHINSELVNFPILISIDDTTGDKCKANGEDILFVLPDNLTILNHEIEKWVDGSNRIVWVNIPIVYSNIDTIFLMYYGNINAVDSQNPYYVWYDYAGVYHFNGDMRDSTIYNRTLTNHGATSQTDGISGGCYNFTSSESDYGDINSITDVSDLTQITIESWARPTAIGGSTLNAGVSIGQYIVGTDPDCDIIWFFIRRDNGKFQPSIGTPFPYNRLILSSDEQVYENHIWTYGAMTIDENVGTNGTLWSYINGSLIGYTDVSTGDYGYPIDFSNITVNTLNIGRDYRPSSTSYYFDGSFDEIRISKILRSGDWINASFNSQNQTTGFITFGSEQEYKTIYRNIPIFTVDTNLSKVNIFGVTSIGNSDSNNYIEIEQTGILTLFGDAKVKRHVRIIAPSWKKGTTAPTDAQVGIFPVYSFDKSGDDIVYYSLIVPYRIETGSKIVVTVDWCYTGTNDVGTVHWNLSYINIDIGDSVDGIVNYINQTSTGNHVSGKLVRTQLTGDIKGSVAHDLLGLRLIRDTSEDTLDTDAHMIQVHFEFTEDKLGEPI